jgi:2-polyprenyl-3-methyl-5-hydroxy-6-metoxy-1,4-benzoquinol methylase
LLFADTQLDRCPLCTADSAPLYDRMRDRWCGVPGEWSLRACTSCELVWIDPQPDTLHIAAVNSGDYYTHTPATDARASLSARALLSVTGMLPIIRELRAARTMFLPEQPQGRLLDVGCGNGGFLATMQQRGWDVEGVEPDLAAAAIASHAIGRQVFAGPLEAAPFAEGSFAAITMNHVIEHVPEPVQTLRACLRLLQPGGALHITTPNTTSLGRRVFGPAWLHWDPPRHLFLFNSRNLRAVVEHAGFDAVAVKTISRAARWSWQATRAA